MKRQLLYNLIEYRFDPAFCSWFKKQTHCTAVAKELACSEKSRLETGERFVRFEVSLNTDKEDKAVLRGKRKLRKKNRKA